MNDNETPQTLAKAIKRNDYRASRDTDESGETAKHCNMFVIGAAIFFAGFWVVACLVGAVLQDGPFVMLKNLTTAVTGF